MRRGGRGGRDEERDSVVKTYPCAMGAMCINTFQRICAFVPTTSLLWFALTLDHSLNDRAVRAFAHVPSLLSRFIATLCPTKPNCITGTVAGRQRERVEAKGASACARTAGVGSIRTSWQMTGGLLGVARCVDGSKWPSVPTRRNSGLAARGVNKCEGAGRRGGRGERECGGSMPRMSDDDKNG